MVSSLWTSRAAATALAEADKQWDAGKHDEAAVKYEANFDFAEDKPKAVKRIAEARADKGDTAGATQWIMKGLENRYAINYESPAAQAIVAGIQKERADKEARQKAEEAAAEAKRKADEAVWDAQRRADDAKRQAEWDAIKQRQEERNALYKRWGDAADASVEAKRVVKSQLNFPAEASFYLFATHDPSEQLNKDGSWTVWGGVTTKNAFGVKEAFLWKVDLIRDESGAWTEIDSLLTPDRD